MSAFVICRRDHEPGHRGPPLHDEIGRLAEAFETDRVRSPTDRAEHSGRRRQPAQQVVAHHLALRTDRVGPCVIVIVIGSVPWKMRAERAGRAPAPGALPPPLLPLRRPAVCVWRARDLDRSPGCGRTSTNSAGISILKIFSRSVIEEPFVDDLECFEGDRLARGGRAAAPSTTVGIAFFSVHWATS